MIIVFCELGGESLLGKAREISGSTGDRVLALVGGDSIEPQRLISLGADEVGKANVSELGDWIELISDMVKGTSKPKLVIFPSNVISNVIMGAVYSRSRTHVGCYLDEAENIDGSTLIKSFDSGFLLRKSFPEDKVCLLGMKISSVPQPFEDDSRYGKTTELQLKKPSDAFPILTDPPEVAMNASSELTVLVGSSEERINGLARRLAEKYHGRILNYSGALSVVYGPCVAMDVVDKLRNLPEFQGDLISLNSKACPINLISDVAVINPDIQKILEQMV